MSAILAPVLMSVLMPCEASGLERRLWEVAVRKFEREDAEVARPSDAVLFYGSSSIRRWRTIEEDMAPRPVIQRGYGGARLSDAVGFVPRVVAPHADVDAIVVFVANDIDGRPNQPTPVEVGELAKDLLARVRESHPDTPLVWIETTPTPARWDLWPLISEANDLIEAACQSDGHAEYLRTADNFLTDGRPAAQWFVSDGIHLNDDGYALWSALIRETLDRRLGPSPRRTPWDEPLLVSTEVAVTEPEAGVVSEEPIEEPAATR